MALPAGTSPAEFAEAVRFALAGRTRTTAPIVSPGSGYAWVEVAFACADGTAASVFRGEDRRGTSQVSLREDGVGRITSGADAVAVRLQELLGSSLADLGRATFASLDIEPLDGWIDCWTGPPGAAESDPPARPTSPIDPEAVDSARCEVGDAADALRRALQVRALRERSARDHEELSALGSRLRRERSDGTGALGRVGAEREILRARLRRTDEDGGLRNEVRSGPATATAPAEPTPPAGAAPVSLEPESRTADAPRARAAAPGDADESGRAEELRTRLAQCDELAAPLQARLERLDDAIATLDVEAGRAARALHCGPPSKVVAAAGLGADETVAAVASRIVQLGDAIHHASVERDALLAQGTYGVGESARAVQAALVRLGAACGDAEGASAVIDREPVSPEEAEALPPDTDAAALVERIESAADELVDRAYLRAAMAPLASSANGATGRADPSAAPAANPSDPAAHARGAATPVVRLEALVTDLIVSLTKGRFPQARIDAGGRLEFEASGDGSRMQWSALEPGLRSRVALALRLRLGEDALRGKCVTSLRVVVLDAIPAGFADDDELASFAAEYAPSVAQVLYGRPAVPTNELPMGSGGGD